MRIRVTSGLALAGLFLVATAPVQARPQVEPKPAFRPAVLLRVSGLEELIADARHLVRLAGREEEAKQIERMLKARTGPKGLEGIDVGKPIGLYATVAAKLTESQGVLLLPIADEKTFLDFLDNLDLKPTKDKDGLHTLNVPNIPPIVFRFANGYLYATVQVGEGGGLPAKDKLPRPATVLTGGSGTLSLTVNIDQIPAQVRRLAVSAAALQLGNLKDEKQPNETPAQKRFREESLDELSRMVKTILDGGGATVVRLGVDRKQDDVSVTVSLAGRPGSALAKDIRSLAAPKSLAAALLGKDSVMGGAVHLALPAGPRKALAPVIDEAAKKGLADLDAVGRDLLGPLTEALLPTARAGLLDLAVDLRGPGKSGKYTLVAAMRVEKGAAIEKALKDAVAKLPAEAREAIKTDVARSDGVNIHRIEQKNVEANARELFGEGPLYFAVRGDAMVVTLGDSALEVLKAALAAKPRQGPAVQLEMAMARVARVAGKQDQVMAQAGRTAFQGKAADKVRLTLQGGDRLELRLRVDGPVIRFAAETDRLRKQAAPPGGN